MSKKITDEIEQDLWNYLASTSKHIVMYGMGNGADKILAVSERYGIKISDFFASDGFVRGHSFHGSLVLSYSQIKEKYGCDNIVVLLSFASSLPNVIDNIKQIASECELYAPDVPVYEDEIFTLEYYLKNEHNLDYVYDLLADNESKRIFDCIIKYKLSGRIDYLFEAESDIHEAYTDILHAAQIRSYADLGAYNGDTIRELMKFAPELEKIYAVEPDERNCRKLSEFCEALGESPKTEIFNVGAWSCRKVATFDGTGNRNSGVAQNATAFVSLGSKRKLRDVQLDTLDALLNDRPVDYIKYDVEGSEREALLGSIQTIQAHSPALLVSLYHKSRDLYDLPLLVRELNHSYKFYLRRMRYIPAWDINLYCIADD